MPVVPPSVLTEFRVEFLQAYSPPPLVLLGDIKVLSLSKMLAQDGCPHAKDMKERDLEGSANLGVTSRDIRRSVRHFMKSF